MLVFAAEVQTRANGEGFKTPEEWRRNNDMLFLRRSRQQPLVLLP
jgi:hypothetical protein